MASKLLHYDVLERLGEGARSTIYLVRDPDTKQQYALTCAASGSMVVCNGGSDAVVYLY